MALLLGTQYPSNKVMTEPPEHTSSLDGKTDETLSSETESTCNKKTTTRIHFFQALLNFYLILELPTCIFLCLLTLSFFLFFQLKFFSKPL